MSTIIAARFRQPEQLQAARLTLGERGFNANEYADYYVNPPGQHGMNPLGGDTYSDKGAEDAGKGAATGAVVGGTVGGAAGIAAGAATGAVAGPVGALLGAAVGAYTGSLAGAMSRTKDAKPGERSAEHPVERPGGLMLAVCADRPGTEAQAIAVFEQCGALDIERCDGIWADGQWTDFDPARCGQIIKAGPRPGEPGGAGQA